MRIIADPGSCHMGDLSMAKELIDVAREAGCSAIKFQLFKDLPPNIELPYKWMPELVEYGKGIEVFASVWDEDGVQALRGAGCRSIKFSYGQRGKAFLSMRGFTSIYVSGDVLHNFHPNHIRLYCIPEYPVPYQINFDCLFHGRFDGFSDHTLGCRQTMNAIRAGAKVIEKHIRLDHASNDGVPDGKFALRPAELREMMNKIQYIHRLP